MFADPRPTERPCQDCDGKMVIMKGGTYSTVYVCTTCGCSLTIPPRYPKTLDTDR